MHIRIRSDLIHWLESNAPTGAIARAIQEGSIENLGAFERLSRTNPDSGWIVKVTSRFNRVWYVAVRVNLNVKGTFYASIFRGKSILWEYWCGDRSKNKLYQGDDPKLYKGLRDGGKTKK